MELEGNIEKAVLHQLKDKDQPEPMESGLECGLYDMPVPVINKLEMMILCRIFCF